MLSATEISPPDAAASTPSLRVGLALSGGGFRATLFHLGVIRALRDCGLLVRVTDICSVSGGSILAAHLVLNWAKYNKSEQEFEAAAEEVINFAKRDVRGNIVRRLPHCYLFRIVLRYIYNFIPLKSAKIESLLEKLDLTLSVTGVLTKHYTHLYKDKYLADLKTSGGEGVPKLYILGTNLNMADTCWFSDDGFSWTNGTMPPVGNTSIPVAVAVAASSAFPGFFPPTVLTRDMLGLSQQELRDAALFVTDAGVYDNLGVSQFLKIHEAADKRHDLIIVSDATGAIDWTSDSRISKLRGTAWRTIDIIMNRAKELQASVAHLPSFGFVKITEKSISPSVTPYALDPSVQRQLKFIRTDLDEFSDLEIRCLIRHGYSVTCKILNEHASIKSSATSLKFEDWTSDWAAKFCNEQKVPIAEQVKKLQSGKNRRMKVWSRRDFVSWLHVALLATVLIIVVFNAPLFIKYFKSGIVYTAAESKIAPVPEPPADKVKDVGLLTAPSYEGFDIVEERQIINMGGWKEVPAELISKVPISPTYRRRMIKLRKTEDKKEFRLDMRTNGARIDIRNLSKAPDSSPLDYYIERAQSVDSIATRLVKIYQLVVDVSKIDTGKEFTIDAEATYWNGFNDTATGKEEWLAITNYGNAKLLALTVIFPAAKPYQNPRLVSYPYGVREEQPFTGRSTLLFDDAHLSLYWEIPDPAVRHVYRLYWKW